MKQLPTGARAYQRTPEFTQATIPQGLLRNHTTKAGAWGHIVVIAGQLKLRIFGAEPEEVVLTPARPGLVEPQVPHEVEPLGDVRFYVEFWRL